jgi:uncharacterized membrane protein
MRIALALHLLAAVLWVGGMAFALLALRPALAPLAPPQRLTVMSGVLARFLPAVGVAIVVLVASGVVLLLPYGGLGAAPAGVHGMVGLGAVMIVIYLYLVVALQPRVRRHMAAADWPAAGAAVERVRRWIIANLILGVLVIIAAATARYG